MKKISSDADILDLLKKYIIVLKIDKLDFPLKSYEKYTHNNRYAYIYTTHNGHILNRLSLPNDGQLYNLQTGNKIDLDKYTNIEFYIEDNMDLTDIKDTTEDLELFFSRLL